MKIKMEHGAGGSEMEKLLKDMILDNLTLTGFENEIGLKELDDGAVIPLDDKKLVFTIDSHTVDPLFFPGGNIGDLAISGTINDLAVMGSRPLALSNAMVMEEGFESNDLEKIVSSMGKLSRETKVPIITGDTKVTDKSETDLIITTAGIGLIENRAISDNGIKKGDKIIVSGPIGKHGLSILSEREGLEFETTIESDVAPIWEVVQEALDFPDAVHAMKDPTRGGLANSLNEMASGSGLGILIKEDRVPVNSDVRTAGELLGIDPLEVACEGRVVMSVSPDKADMVLNKINETDLGKDAVIFGEVLDEFSDKVVLETDVGGKRYLDRPTGDPVPRVC